VAPIVVLTGFMGSGKSTVGREVAARLGWSFVDLDEAIVQLTGEDIPSIFRDEGEAGFRAREVEALKALFASADEPSGLVVALGGGTLTNPEALDIVRKRALLVHLDVNATVAWNRVAGSDRPLAQDRQGFEDLLAERSAGYAEAADLSFAADATEVEELSATIVAALREAKGDGR
jgi:shikimate kinase